MAPDTVTLSKGTSSNFEVIIPRLPTMTLLRESEDLILHVHESLIPGMSIETSSRKWMGIKVDEQPGTGIIFEDWKLGFSVDAELKNWRILQQWFNFITAAKADQTEHLLPSQFTVNAALMLYDNFRNPLVKVIFLNTWISALGEIRVSNRESSPLESSATFKYNRYEIEALNET
jgi:hypothetical protein